MAFRRSILIFRLFKHHAPDEKSLGGVESLGLAQQLLLGRPKFWPVSKQVVMDVIDRTTLSNWNTGRMHNTGESK